MKGMGIQTNRREPPVQTLDVTGLPSDVIQVVKSLVTVLRSRPLATGAGHLPGGAPDLPPAVERLLDTDFLAQCEADTSPEVPLAEVRGGLASIMGDLTADFAAEREER